jgi:hypothetical protein
MPTRPRPTPVFAAMAAVAVLAGLAFSMAARAQSLIEQVLSPQARAPQIEPSVWAGGTLAHDGRNNPDRISDWRTGLSTNLPLWSGTRPGMEEARKLLHDPTVTGLERRNAFRTATAPGVLAGNMFGEYRSFRDRTGTVPGRLISAGMGLFGVHEIEDHERPVRLGGVVEYAMRSDFEDTSPSRGQLTVSSFVIIPSGELWTFITGLAYASRVQNEDLEGIPLPFFAATYVPSNHFTLVLGLPFNMVMWRPYDWLELRGVAVGGLNGEVSVTERPSKNLSFRQFYGSHGEVYDLTAPVHTKDTRLIFTGLRAGNEITWNATAYLAVELRYELQFEGRIRTQDRTTAFTDRRYEPGHAFRLSLSMRF